MLVRQHYLLPTTVLSTNGTAASSGKPCDACHFSQKLSAKMSDNAPKLSPRVGENAPMSEEMSENGPNTAPHSVACSSTIAAAAAVRLCRAG